MAEFCRTTGRQYQVQSSSRSRSGLCRSESCQLCLMVSLCGLTCRAVRAFFLDHVVTDCRNDGRATDVATTLRLYAGAHQNNAQGAHTFLLAVLQVSAIGVWLSEIQESDVAPWQGSLDILGGLCLPLLRPRTKRVLMHDSGNITCALSLILW